jgi:hypothetical protein
VSTASDRHLASAIVELRAASALGCTTAAMVLPVALGAVQWGRPRLDDEAALRQIRALQASGSKHAVSEVARQLAAGADHESIGRRLRGKLRG